MLRPAAVSLRGSYPVSAVKRRYEAFGHAFDGLVMVPNCDKNVPGLLMAAARLNIPTIFVSSGPMLAGKVKDRRASYLSVSEAVSRLNVGDITEDALEEYEKNACHYTEDLNEAGGVYAVMHELDKKDLLHTDLITCTRKTVAENICNCDVKNYEVIKNIDNPYSLTGGIAVLYGNIAMDGAVIKQAAVSDKMLCHEGPAKVFDCEEDAVKAIYENQIHPGDVVVIRYEGPKGGPGMREMLNPTSAIIGSGLGESVALITDGRFSGATRGAFTRRSPNPCRKSNLSSVLWK